MKLRRLRLLAPRLGEPARHIVAVLIGLVFSGAIAAQETPPTRVAEPLRFRRLLMLEDLIAEQGMGYLPIQRATFEAAVRDDSPSEGSPRAARIVAALYSARFLPDGALRGQAELTVMHAGQVPTAIAFDPLNLAVGNVRWRAESRPSALAGVNATGEHRLVVDKPGVLEFDWSRRAEPRPSGQYVYHLRFPASPSNRIHLELPAGWVPVCPQAVIQQIDNTVTLSMAQLWQLELGGQQEVNIELLDEGSSVTPPLVFVRESHAYRVSPSGVQLHASMSLDVQRQAARELLLETSSDLRIAAAQSGDTPVEVEKASQSKEVSVYRLRFAEPQLGNDLPLSVTAIGPVVTDRSWRLPTLRIPAATWESGTLSLEVLEPLWVTSLAPANAVVRKVEPLALPERGEFRDFQCYAPSHHVDLRLSVSPQELTADTGYMLRSSESVLTAQLVADIQSLRGESFEIQGTVQPGWVIDSVQTEPAESLEGFQTQGAAPQTLRIRLRQALRPDRKLRIILRGHRRSLVAGRAVPVANLRFARLQNVAQRSGLVELAVEPPLRMTVTGDQDAVRVDPSQLTAAETSRLNMTPGATLFRDLPSVDAMSISVAPEQAKYSAQVGIEARVEGQSLSQSYEFLITPERSHVGRVVASFSERGTTTPDWELVGLPDNSLAARKLDASVAGSAGEFWELVLLRPLNTPFILRTSLKTRFSQGTKVALAAVPEASSQSGRVRLLATDGLPLEIVSHNLQAMPVGRLQDEEVQTLRGVYTFAPSQDASLELARPGNHFGQQPAWIWLCDVSSRLTNTGHVRHRAVMLVENLGLASVSFRLPPQATLISASIDSQESMSGIPNTAGQISLSLPRGRRFPTVTLTYTTELPPFHLGTSLESVWPQGNLPFLERRWKVWTPAGMSSGSSLWRAADSVAWDKRLFGVPLVRRQPSVFDPLSLDQWRQLWRIFEPAGPRSVAGTGAEPALRGPWSNAAWESDETSAGWSCHAMSVSPLDNPSVLVYSTRALHAGGWGLALITTAVSLWWGSAGRRAMLGLALAMIACLTLGPLELLPLFRGVLLGVASAQLLLVVPRRVRMPISMEPQTSASHRRLAHTTSLLLAAIVLLALAGDGTAQERADVPGDAARQRVVYPVLIPVDAQHNPTGEYVYVPQQLFEELHRRAAESDGSTLGPLMTSAQYFIEVAPVEGQKDVQSIRHFVAEYELAELAPQARLRLPFRRDLVRISDVRLDGQTVSFEWDQSGQFLDVLVERADTRELEVRLHPALADNAPQDFSLPIPIIPNSRVTVQGSESLARLSLPTVVGEMDRTTDGQLFAELGPASELVLQWEKPAEAEPFALEGDVAELFWLRFQPGSVMLHCQFKCAVSNGYIEQLDIEVDPRLRLLPQGLDPEALRVEELQVDGVRILRCALHAPAPDEAQMDLSFAMTGSWGNVRIPKVLARATRRAPPWLAVSATDELETRMLPEGAAPPIPVADFAQSWGAAVDPLQWAVILPDTERVWQIAVRPRDKVLTADEDIDITLGNSQASVAYEALVAIEHGSSLEQTFRIPPGFEPRDVLVIHDDINRALRWSRLTDDTLTVFFTVPLTNSYRIWIEGDMPLGRTSFVEIPVLTAKNMGRQNYRVRVFYQSDLQPRLITTPGLQLDEGVSAPESPATSARLLARLSGLAEQADATIPSLRLSLEANRPRMQGTVVTTLSANGSQWEADVFVRQQIRNGYASVLRLRVPPELTDLSAFPTLAMEETSLPGERDRQLVVYLPQVERRECQLRLHGKLIFPDGESARAPEIQLLDASELKQYLVLPKAVDRTPLIWKTSGMQAADLPPGTNVSAEQLAEGDVYQIVGRDAQAELETADRIEGTPQVHLADYRWRWFSDRRCQGIATFDLEPAGIRELILLMPPGLSLVHVSAGGMAALPKSSAEGRWTIPLNHLHLPQRIEVVFAGELEQSAPGAETVSLMAPMLDNVPYKDTLWTVQGPEGAGAGQLKLGHTRVSPAAATRKRLEVARALMDVGRKNSASESSRDTETWQSSWQNWLTQLESELRLWEGRGASLLPRQTALSGPRYSLTSRWEIPDGQATGAVHSAFRGASNRLELTYSSASWSSQMARLGTMALLLVGLGLVRFFPKTEWWAETLRRYPHFVIGSVGALWWLWLSPSVVGLAVVLIASGLSLRPAWRSRRA